MTLNNEELKKMTDEGKEVYDTFLDGEDLDDEQLAITERLKDLSQLDKDLLYLYSTYGATKTARLCQCSRQYIYKKIKQIKSKLYE